MTYVINMECNMDSAFGTRLGDGTWNIPLRNKNGVEVGTAKVSHEDYDKVNGTSWHVERGYAVSKLGRMHRIIAAAPESTIVHHINHNRLDNTRANLVVTDSWKERQQSTRNAHGMVASILDDLFPSESIVAWNCSMIRIGKIEFLCHKKD